MASLLATPSFAGGGGWLKAGCGGCVGSTVAGVGAARLAGVVVVQEEGAARRPARW
jgi:hypothetical protein